MRQTVASPRWSTTGASLGDSVFLQHYQICVPPSEPSGSDRKAVLLAAMEIRNVTTSLAGPQIDLARARGRAYMRSILARPDMCSGRQAQSLCRKSRKTVARWRRQGRLLALKLPEAAGGCRYPEWQFEPCVRVVMPLIRAAFSGASPWRVYGFFTRREPLLQDLVPLDLIRAGSAVDVLRVARVICDGSQGAL